MNCPLVGTHDPVTVLDPAIGLVQVCRDCDAVLLSPDLAAMPSNPIRNGHYEEW